MQNMLMFYMFYMFYMDSQKDFATGNIRMALIASAIVRSFGGDCKNPPSLLTSKTPSSESN